MDKIKKYPNSKQWFYRTLLHELLHAKQYKMLEYAKKNVNNKKLNKQDIEELKEYIKNSGLSEKDSQEINKFKNKYSQSDIKKNKKLLKKYKDLYNKYENAYWEIDADNVALALQYYIGNANNENIKNYLDVILSSESLQETQTDSRLLNNIKGFNRRRKVGFDKNGKIVHRLSSIIDTNIFYQDEPEQQSIFEGNNKARGFRKYKGAYMPAENIIEFFKGADESTIVHEFAHWYLNALVEDAKYHEGSKLDLDAVRKFVRNNSEPFTREQHEKFARGFEAYVRSGWAKNKSSKKALMRVD